MDSTWGGYLHGASIVSAMVCKHVQIHQQGVRYSNTSITNRTTRWKGHLQHKSHQGGGRVHGGGTVIYAAVPAFSDRLIRYISIDTKHAEGHSIAGNLCFYMRDMRIMEQELAREGNLVKVKFEESPQRCDKSWHSPVV